MLLRIRLQEDFKAVIAFQQVAVRQALEMNLVDSIRCVGDKLTQENLVIRIDGVDHQVQELFSLGLKFMGFFCHFNLPFFIWIHDLRNLLALYISEC